MIKIDHLTEDELEALIAQQGAASRVTALSDPRILRLALGIGMFYVKGMSDIPSEDRHSDACLEGTIGSAFMLGLHVGHELTKQQSTTMELKLVMD